jgi:serine/threonine protein phosphatase PrpC
MVVNESRPGSGHAMGFDAFDTSAPEGPVFVLCDGANGTPQGGDFARALSSEFLGYFSQNLPKGDSHPDRPSVDLAQVGRELDTLGESLDNRFIDSAATLTAARFHQERLQLLHVGDSHVMAFQRRMIRGWHHVHSLGRHQDSAGHPTQLIGAPVPVQPYWFETATPGDWMVALMTDGAGDFLDPHDLIAQLKLVGRRQPSQQDLTYCAQCLSQLALSRHSDDDISVCLIWMRLR